MSLKETRENSGLETNEGSMIRKRNDLISGSSQMTVAEIKLFSMILSQIKTTDESLKEYFISAEEYGRRVGIKNPYTFLEQTVDKLMSRVFEIPTGVEGKRKKINLYHQAEYLDTEGKVAMKIHEDMAPYLLQLKSNFTKYDSRYILKLKSKYAITLYELIKKKFGLNRNPEYLDISLSVKDLRRDLDIGEKFVRISQIKDRVLNKSKIEINKHTDIEISYEPIKVGRKIIGFIIHARQKNAADIKTINNKEFVEINPQSNNSDRMKKDESLLFLDSKDEIASRLSTLGIDVDEISDELIGKSDKDILKAISIVEKNLKDGKKIEYLKNYTISIIRNTVFTPFEAKRQENKNNIEEIKIKKEKKEDEEFDIITKKNNKILKKYYKLSEIKKVEIIEKLNNKLKKDMFASNIIHKEENDIKDKLDLKSYPPLMQSMFINALEDILD